MKVIFVVNRINEWHFEIPGATAITARTYLTDPAYSTGVEAHLVNLCRCDRHQGRGYYVSLLAEARGHRPLPDVRSIEDLQSEPLAALIARDIESLVQRSLQHDATRLFEIDAYFGRDPAGRYDDISRQLFTLARAPLLRALFCRQGDNWRLAKIRAIGLTDIPPQHRPFLARALNEYVTGTNTPAPAPVDRRQPRIAILHDPQAQDAPSNNDALQRFVAAAATVGLQAEVVGREALDRLNTYAGLFIRDTTNVGHYTYEFSRRAAALGLVVIDDPDSILKCTNKVYLNELMLRHQVPVPRTLMVHRDNVDQIIPALGLPCVLKQPDSAFSLGVSKVHSAGQLAQRINQLLQKSELVIAQEYLPTDFDWRVGVLDGRPLFVCKYFMAPGHWQVIKRDSSARVEGQTRALAVGEAPEAVIRTAVRAAGLIGDGFYGVDVKQVRDHCYLIEVNDNPNVDAGNEDQVLGDALYREIMGVFARRIRERHLMAAA